MKKSMFSGIAITAMLSVSVIQADDPVSGSWFYNCENLAEMKDTTEDCPANIRMKVDGLGDWRWGIWNNDNYNLAEVWLRAKLSNASSFTEIRDYKNDIGQEGGAVGVVFYFNADWLANKLGTDVATIKSDGYKVEMKIRSVGLGSGLNDKCHVAAVRWDDSKGWEWRKDTSDSKWHDINSDSVFMYKSAGSVNAVKCDIKDIGGPTVN